LLQLRRCGAPVSAPHLSFCAPGVAENRAAALEIIGGPYNQNQVLALQGNHQHDKFEMTGSKLKS
jgi:hypothetical protein